MPITNDQRGTSNSFFQIGLRGIKLLWDSARTALSLTDSSGNPAAIVTSKPLITGNTIELNTNAAGSGSDWKMTISRPNSGMTATVGLVLPTTAGSPAQVLQTDGAGSLSWVTISTVPEKDTTHIANLSFGTTSPLTLFTIPIGAVIKKVQVVVDTAFNGTNPTLSIGTSGNTSLLMGANQNDLTDSTGTAVSPATYEVNPNEIASGSALNLIATYSAGGSTAGAGRIFVVYSIPTTS